MTKEEFKRKIAALKKQEEEIKSEYIKTNTVYQPGTKLRVTQLSGRVREGVVQYSIVEYDEVVPYVTMITKAGEDSTRRVRIWQGDKVEIIG